MTAAAFTPQQLEILESIKVGASSSWILTSMAVIFFMQLGFIMVEAGAVKRQHWPGILIKNFLDTITGAIAFWIKDSSALTLIKLGSFPLDGTITPQKTCT